MQDTEMRDFDHHEAVQPRPGVLSRWLRNARGAPRWGLLIGAAVVVLAVGLLAGIWGTSSNSSNSSSASAQAAQRSRAANHVLETEGWTLYNHSDSTLEYVDFDQGPNGGDLEGGGPPKQTAIPPGHSLHFEQVFLAGFTSTSVILKFWEVNPPNGEFTFTLTDSPVNVPSASADGPDPLNLVTSVDSDGHFLNVNNR